jgi:hypothetical protein
VCLDTPTEIYLVPFILVDIDLEHSPRRSFTLSAHDELLARRLNTRCVSQSAKSILPSLLTPALSTAHDCHNVYMMSKVGSSNALRQEEQSAISSVNRDR